MLTRKEYEKLWDDYFKPHVGAIPKPDYNDYVIRCNFYEDYLDIFRGEDTRPHRGGGNNPFFKGGLKLDETPKIKYIMIGEACPPLNVPDLNNYKPLAGDKKNTYFYNITHLKQTHYLNSPRIIWDCPPFKPCPKNKIETLFCLAQKGYLLLDLYPFAIKYSTPIRELLINYRPFWDLLCSEITGLSNTNLLTQKVLLAFSGPAATHHRIVLDLIAGITPLPVGTTCNLNENKLRAHAVLLPNIRHNYIFRWTLPNPAVPIFLNVRPIPVVLERGITPIYQCECWNGSYISPDILFIKVAFDLP